MSRLQNTTSIASQNDTINEHELERNDSFGKVKTSTQTLLHSQISEIKYDIIGKIAEGTTLTRRSVERKFAKSLDGADEVCVYAKLPKGFQIPTPVGNYSPDWAIAFNVGTVKHIYFIAETKGTMESLSLRPIEQSKISCAKKLFNEISTNEVRYHDVDGYQNLLNVMESIK